MESGAASTMSQESSEAGARDTKIHSTSIQNMQHCWLLCNAMPHSAELL